MIRLKICKIIFIIFEIIIIKVTATTHWVVTENGRIQAQKDSVFYTGKPHDLPGFLDQEKRMNDVKLLYKKIMARKVGLDKQMAVLNSIGDLETWLQSSNPDCILNKKLLDEFDFYASVATDGGYRHGILKKDYLLDGIPNDEKYKIPDCKKTFPLEFSIHTFEHLNAMKNRKNLTQHKEKDLIKYLPSGTDLNKFGHQISYGLIRNNTSWLHLNLAAIYWRVRGNAYEALECSRRSIVTSPIQYRDIPLLTTGGILHASKHSAEAAIILHAAIDYAPDQSHQYLALGHVYAILGFYSQSIACYDNSLRLTPTMEQAKQAKFVVYCCQSLENSLTALHKRLDDIVTELNAQQNDYAELLKIEQKILCQLGDKMNRFGPISMNQEQFCIQQQGQPSLSCKIVTDNQIFARNLELDIGISLKQLKNVEIQVEKINNLMSTSKVLYPFDDEKNNEKITDNYSIFMEPTVKPKYHNFIIKKSKNLFENKNWPDSSECNDKLLLLLNNNKEYLSIYLPPENKGYVTDVYVNELIGIEPDKEHALPWYPPVCQPPDNYNEKYITQSLLKSTFNNYLPEINLSFHLENLVKNAELAEIGQRILTATKTKVGSPWVLAMLSSLHWRVVGKPKNALDCLKIALNTVPNKFKDVPLVSIAAIGYKVGLIDDAIKAVKEAIRINSVEPTTNYLYGVLLNAKGNLTGAIYHLKQTLRVEPDAFNGKALMLLKSIICQKRINIKQAENNVDKIESCGLSYSSLEIIEKKHELNDGDTVLCLGDGTDCKPIQCFSMKINSEDTSSP